MRQEKWESKYKWEVNNTFKLYVISDAVWNTASQKKWSESISWKNNLQELFSRHRNQKQVRFILFISVNFILPAPQNPTYLRFGRATKSAMALFSRLSFSSFIDSKSWLLFTLLIYDHLDEVKKEQAMAVFD